MTSGYSAPSSIDPGSDKGLRQGHFAPHSLVLTTSAPAAVVGWMVMMVSFNPFRRGGGLVIRGDAFTDHHHWNRRFSCFLRLADVGKGYSSRAQKNAERARFCSWLRLPVSL